MENKFASVAVEKQMNNSFTECYDRFCFLGVHNLMIVAIFVFRKIKFKGCIY